MSQVTITTAALLPGFTPPAGLTQIEARLYCDKPFVPLGAAAPVQSGAVGSSSFYKKFTCTVSNDVLTLPEIALEATTDGSPGDAKYSISFYQPGAPNQTQRIEPFAGLTSFSLTPTSPQTWAQVFNLNNPGAPLNLAGAGFLAQTSALNFALRTLTGTSGEIAITNPAGVAGNPTVSLASPLTLTNPRITTDILDSNGNEILRLAPVSNAVNYIQFINNIAGSEPFITAFGDDANIDLRIAAKNNARVIIPGYAYTLVSDSTSTGNVGAGLDTIHTYSLDANSLPANGDYVRAKYGGSFAGNNNTKRIVVSIDAEIVFDSGARDIDTAISWFIEVEYKRISATSVRVNGSAMLGRILGGVDGALDTGNSRYYLAAINAEPSIANLESSAVILLVEAEGTANNDIFLNSATIELVQR